MERPDAAPNLRKQKENYSDIKIAPEKTTDHEIIFSYTHLCADHFQSTGEYPSWEQLTNLFSDGYADHHPSEVFRILRDEEMNDELELLHGLASVETQRRAKEEYEDKQYLSKIARATDLPEDLGRKIVWETRPGTNNKFGTLTDDPVEEDELIRRVLLFRAARELLGEEFMMGEASQSRLVDIALGMNRSGKRLASFPVEIKYSNPSIEDWRITDILHTPWEDYARPDEVKNFKSAIRTSSTTKRNRTGKKQRFHNELPYLDEATADETEVAFDLRNGKLLVGKYAVEFARLLPGSKDVRDVTELILSDTPDLNFADKKRFQEFTPTECRRYGGWLLKLLEPKEHTLNADILERSTQMGLGPGIGGIQRIYNGSLIDFYDDIGIEKKNAKYSYDNMGIDEMVIYINSVANNNDGKISQQILTDHYRQMRAQGIKVPSPQTLMRVSGLEIGALFELAGHRVIQRKMSAEVCATAVADYYRREGRLPNSRELAADPDMPSWPTARRYCGNLPNLHRMAMEIINKDSLNHLEIVPGDDSGIDLIEQAA